MKCLLSFFDCYTIGSSKSKYRLLLTNFNSVISIGIKKLHKKIYL